MVEANNSVSTASLANRRGFLLGITLAEILLITLFVLLLLFRHSQEKAIIADSVISVIGEKPVGDLVAASSDLPPSNASMDEQIAEITETLIDCRELQAPACFEQSDPTSDGEGLIPDDAETSTVNEEQNEPLAPEQAKEEIEDLKAQLEAAREELRRRRKSGEKPFCTYAQPAQGSLNVRGPNISVGTFLIEGDGITLIARDRLFQRNEFVDFNGELYDGSEAISEINRWPLGEKLTPTEFGKKGAAFLAIGDRDAEKRATCRFGADFFYEPTNATDRAREEVFEKYFFLGGKRLNRKEYLNRKQG